MKLRHRRHSYGIKPLKLLLALTLIPQLGACGKGEPIQIADDGYFGTWVHKENAFGNDVRIDNRLLAVYRDSTVSYFRCSKRGGASTRVSIPDGYISKLSAHEMIVEADLFITTMELEFRIDQRPFKHDGEWFMKMDGVEFRKLHPGEPSDHESWPCPSEE